MTDKTVEALPDDVIARRIHQYVQIRDKLKAMDEEHEEKREKLVKIQSLLSGYMEQFLEKVGAQNIKTPFGTCHRTTRYTSSLADPDAFMNFVTSTGKFELLDRRANSEAVKDYVNEHGVLPPGVNLSALRSIGVRRATKQE
jgi:hypothetical protein